MWWAFGGTACAAFARDFTPAGETAWLKPVRTWVRLRPSRAATAAKEAGHYVVVRLKADTTSWSA